MKKMEVYGRAANPPPRPNATRIVKNDWRSSLRLVVIPLKTVVVLVTVLVCDIAYAVLIVLHSVTSFPVQGTYQTPAFPLRITPDTCVVRSLLREEVCHEQPPQQV